MKNFLLFVGVFVACMLATLFKDHVLTAANTVPCSTQSATSVAASTATVPSQSQKDNLERNSKIVDAVQRFAVYNGELDNADSELPKTAVEAASKAQWWYGYVDKYQKLSAFVAKNELSGYTIGYSSKDITSKQRVALQRTIDFALRTKALGRTNRCLWEGGCFTDDEINRTIKELRKELKNLS